MPVIGNLIKIEPSTYYAMRQCNEIIKHLKQQNNPIYDVEIKGEKELYNIYMKETLTRVA